MEKLSKNKIKDIYIWVLKNNSKIKIVDDKITLCFVYDEYYQEWIIEDNLWEQIK